jgi:hypothetical protein
MRHLPLLLLAAMLLIVGLFSAFVGLIWQGTPPPATEVLSVRGEAVKLTGSGIYRYNPAMLGAGFSAQDVVQLVVLPVLALSALAFARGREAAI